MSFRGRAQYGQNYRGRLQYVNNYRNNSRRGNFRGTQLFIEVKILELDIEVTVEMITLEEVEVGPWKDNIWVILKRMMETVVKVQDCGLSF